MGDRLGSHGVTGAVMLGRATGQAERTRRTEAGSRGGLGMQRWTSCAWSGVRPANHRPALVVVWRIGVRRTRLAAQALWAVRAVDGSSAVTVMSRSAGSVNGAGRIWS